MTGLRFSKFVVAINCGVPLALLGWDAFRGRLGADPVNYATRTTGLLSLIFLLLSLTVTPVRRLTGWNTLVGFRRALGLYGFVYAAVHLGVYVVFAQALDVGSAMREILSRRYLQIGFAGLLVMVPLALTSTDGMIRRLGPRRWKALHRLAYVAAIAGAVHFYMQAKSDVRLPVTLLVILGALLLMRAVWHYMDLRRAAARAQASVATRGSSTAAKPAANRKFWSGELRVARTFDETPDVRTFRLVAPDGGDLPFDYRPGQYLTLRLTVDGRPVNRSYTIASSPTRRGYCELTVKREEMGVSSGHLHRQVREGDRLKVSAPAGKFVFTGAEADGVVLIAGGVGITPLMSIVRYLTDHCWPGTIDLVVAARTERDIIFRDEIEQLHRRFPNLRVCVTLSRVEPGGGWAGERGRVSAELLGRFVPEIGRRLVYLCGPDEMMAAVRRALGELGVAEANVRTEAFVSPGTSQVDTTERAAVGGDLNMSVDSIGDAESAVQPASAADGRTVTFVQSKHAGPLADGTTVLDAAEALGVDIPFECRAGVCGQCKTRLVAGSVKMATEEALSASEKAGGWILACQAVATGGDVTVRA